MAKTETETAKAKDVVLEEVCAAIKEVIDRVQKLAGNLPPPWNKPQALLNGAIMVLQQSQQKEALDAETTLQWGKYSGKKVQDALRDMSYVKWLLRNEEKIVHPQGLQLLQRMKQEYVLTGNLVHKIDQVDAMAKQLTATSTVSQELQTMIQAEVAAAVKSATGA